MKSMMQILLDSAVNDRFPFIQALAEERNPEEWQEQRAVINEVLDYLKQNNPSLRLRLDNALAGSEASLQEASYFLGMADGMQMAKLTDEKVNKSELIYG